MPTLILLALGCTAPAPPPPAEPVPIERPAIAYPRPTTAPELAVDGLNQRINTLVASVERLPDTRGPLLEALSLRIALLGRVSDLTRMEQLAGDTPLRAKALLAAHRFDDALAADPGVAESVALARHQGLDAMEADRRAAVEARPSSLAWQRLGDVLAAQGKALEADAAYASALDTYKDVSPLAVADLQFRRGLLWGESGEDPERARALYADAIARLPPFVRAQVHLAELEWQAGLPQQAIARVREVADAEDPEPGGKLAVWLDGEEAAQWRARTTLAYEALLARHPLAFADHGAEYFLAIGELDRARELAKLNVDNRRTPRAIDLCERTSCEP